MKARLYLSFALIFLVSGFLFGLSGLILSDPDPSNPQWQKKFLAAMPEIYASAVDSLKQKDYPASLKIFSLISACREILNGENLEHILIYTVSVYYVEYLWGRISISPDGDWRQTDPFRLIDGDLERRIPDKTFTLTLADEGGNTPLAGIFYSIAAVSRTEIFVTDAQGKGSIPSRFYAESQDGVQLQMRFGSLHPDFHLPAGRTVTWEFPAVAVKVIIRNGERVRDLVKRWKDSGLTTENAFAEYALKEDLSGYFFVPRTNRMINRFEGLFRPGEYFIEKRALAVLDPKAGDFSRKAYQNVQVLARTLLEAARARFEKMTDVQGVKPSEQIILASIVEKEAAGNRDYGKIASVFYNRHTRGGRLASCPTVEYALGYHRPFLSKSDVSIDSPYNVYRRKGLPPTPICFFSDDALEAVGNPPQTRLYYFVFDWTTGELTFASKYSDHERNAETARANYIRKYGEKAMKAIHYDLYYGE